MHQTIANEVKTHNSAGCRMIYLDPYWDHHPTSGELKVKNGYHQSRNICFLQRQIKKK